MVWNIAASTVPPPFCSTALPKIERFWTHTVFSNWLVWLSVQARLLLHVLRGHKYWASLLNQKWQRCILSPGHANSRKWREAEKHWQHVIEVVSLVPAAITELHWTNTDVRQEVFSTSVCVFLHSPFAIRNIGFCGDGRGRFVTFSEGLGLVKNFLD